MNGIKDKAEELVRLCSNSSEGGTASIKKYLSTLSEEEKVMIKAEMNFRESIGIKSAVVFSVTVAVLSISIVGKDEQIVVFLFLFLILSAIWTCWETYQIAKNKKAVYIMENIEEL